MHSLVKIARPSIAYHQVICSRVSKLSSQSAETESSDKVTDAVDPLLLKDEEIAALQTKLAAESKLLSEMKNKYLRALADGENVRNRAKKELEDSKIFSIQSFAKVT
jgi:molecular chaperone GrpE